MAIQHRINFRHCLPAPTVWALAAAVLYCAGGGPALAQQYYDPGVMQAPVTQKPEGYRTEGVRLGAFTLSPAMDIAVEHHDNIYYQNENEVSDTVYHFRPKAALSSGWSRHALSLSVLGDFARYSDNSREDYDDLVLSLDGRIDVRRGQYFTVRAATMELHEERSSPDDPGGVEPTDFSLDRYGVGYTHNFNRLTASVNWALDETDYDNNRDEAGILIENGDRDRRQETLSLRLDYHVAPQRALFLSLSGNEVSYDLPSDFEGYARDSDGFRVQAGVVFDISGVLTGDTWVQYLEQDYDDPRFDELDDVGFGMGLTWLPTRLTTVSLRAEHSPLETTQPGTSGYLASIYSARVQHELRRWLLLHGRVSWTDNDYELTPEALADALTGTEVKRADIGLSYLFNPHLNLTAGYAWEEQDANRAVDRYRANRIYLVLSLEL